MATAAQLRQEFQQYLDQKGCRYTVVDESDKRLLSTVLG